MKVSFLSESGVESNVVLDEAQTVCLIESLRFVNHPFMRDTIEALDWAINAVPEPDGGIVEAMLTEEQSYTLPDVTIGSPFDQIEEAARVYLQEGFEPVDAEPGEWLQLRKLIGNGEHQVVDITWTPSGMEIASS